MANLFLILTIIFWGAGSFFGKLSSIKGLSPIFIFLIESLGTLTITIIVSIFYKKEFLNFFQKFSWAGYLFGLLWGIGTITFIIALKYKPANTATAFTALYPLVATLLAFLFLKETITIKIGIGITLAIIAGFLLI